MTQQDGELIDAEGVPYLSKIVDLLGEISSSIKPEEDSPNTAKAQMAGVAFGFSDMLTEILDDAALDTMKKAKKLRELATRAKALGNQYSAEQAQIDQSYVSKKQRVKNSIWKTSDGDGS